MFKHLLENAFGYLICFFLGAAWIMILDIVWGMR